MPVPRASSNENRGSRLVPAWQRTVGAKTPVAGGGARAATLALVVVAAVISSSLAVHAVHAWF